MSYSFAISNALSLVRQLVVSDLTIQGCAPAAVPYSFVSEQNPESPSDLPLTVIEVKQGKVSRDDGANMRTFTLPVAIHHYRARVAGSNAEVDALGILAHLAATCENDPRLTLLSPTINIAIVEPGLPGVSSASLNGSQNVSIAHAFLSIDLSWNEYRLT